MTTFTKVLSIGSGMCISGALAVEWGYLTLGAILITLGVFYLVMAGTITGIINKEKNR